MLHRVPWKRKDTYGAIAEFYVIFTIQHYNVAAIVFDGYERGPFIKDNTNQRRGHNVNPIFSFTLDTKFSGKEEEFLSRISNKQQLINLISDDMVKLECNVINVWECRCATGKDCHLFIRAQHLLVKTLIC